MGKYVVRARFGLNLRDAPSPQGEIVELLALGSEVEVKERIGPWVEVRTTGGRRGFVHASYLSPVNNGEGDSAMPEFTGALAKKALADGNDEFFLTYAQHEKFAKAINKYIDVPLLLDEQEEFEIFIKIVQSLDRNIYKYTPKQITSIVHDSGKTVQEAVVAGIRRYLAEMLANAIPLVFVPLSVKISIIEYAIDIILQALAEKTTIDDILNDLLA